MQIKNKQKWIPKETHHTIDTFIHLVENDINNAKSKKNKKPKTQFNKEEKTAMEELAERTDIVITNTDRDEAVVIMNTDDEADHQLSDKDNYKQLPNNSTL